MSSVMAVHPNGQAMAVADRRLRSLRLWDLDTGKEFFKNWFPGDPKQPAVGKGKLEGNDSGLPPVAPLPEDCSLGSPMAFSPDGRILAATIDGRIHLHDWSKGMKLRILQAARGVQCLRFSPDSNLIAAGGDYREPLQIWNVATGREIHSIQDPGSVLEIAFSVDGALVAYGTSSKVHLFNHKKGMELFQSGPDGNSHPQVALSADGRTLMDSMGDSVRFTEVATGKERLRLRSGSRYPDGGIRFSISPDGAKMATTCANGTLLVWDLAQVVLGDRAGQPTDKELPELWADLAAEDAGRAYRSIWRLAVFPKQCMTLFKRELHRIEPVTTEVKKGHALESNQLRQIRIVETLERIATPEACVMLHNLSQGAPQAQLTKDAQAALERLKKTSVPSH